eukprot:COSAG02_NODE_16961_length_1040_cov_1.180659_1_plen_62_part_10
MSDVVPAPEPAPVSRLPQEQGQAGAQHSVGVGGRVFSAADLERQLLGGLQASANDIDEALQA